MPFFTKFNSLRTAAVVALSALSLGACATRDYVDEQVVGVNGRIDAVDARVQQASQRADTASTDARTVNQRVDQLEARITRLEQAPVRTPRG